MVSGAPDVLGAADVGLTSDASCMEHEVVTRMTPTLNARTAVHLLAGMCWRLLVYTDDGKHVRPTSALDDRTLLGEVTGDPVSGLDLDGHRHLDGAHPVSYTHLRAHETDSYLVCR